MEHSVGLCGDRCDVFSSVSAFKEVFSKSLFDFAACAPLQKRQCPAYENLSRMYRHQSVLVRNLQILFIARSAAQGKLC